MHRTTTHVYDSEWYLTRSCWVTPRVFSRIRNCTLWNPEEVPR